MTISLRKIFVSCQFCLILFSVFACENNLIVSHRDLNEEIVVLSLLCPAFERQEVYVGSSLPQMPPIDVSGARVQIKDSTNTYTFKEVEPGLYRDVDSAFEVLPGSEYSLYVETPNGKHVSASTRVPSEFEITNIAPGDTLDQSYYFSNNPVHIFLENTPTVEYCPSRSALVYQILVTLKDSFFYQLPTLLTFDNKVNFPNLWTHVDTTLITPVKLFIFAWDSTYSNYASDWALLGFISEFRADSSFSEFYKSKESCPKTLTNVTGGLGIFGSASVASVEFYLKYRSEVNP